MNQLNPKWASMEDFLGSSSSSLFSNSSSVISRGGSEGLSEMERLIISIVGIVSCTLSFIGVANICLIFVFISQVKRKLGGRLILYLSISDFIWTFSVFLGLVYFLLFPQSKEIPTPICIITGFTLQWFIVASDLWIMCIAFYLLILILFNKDLGKFEIFFHIYSWGIALFFAIIPLFGFIPVEFFETSVIFAGGYGMAGSWCWVRNPASRLFYSYFFAWSAFLVIVVCYTVMVFFISWTSYKVTRHSNIGSVKRRLWKKNMKVFRKFMLFPLVFLLLWIPATINRIQNFIWPDYPIAFLYALHIGSVSACGMGNFLVYGGAYRRHIQKKFASIYKKIFKRRSKEQEKLLKDKKRKDVDDEMKQLDEGMKQPLPINDSLEIGMTSSTIIKEERDSVLHAVDREEALNLSDYFPGET